MSDSVTEETVKRWTLWRFAGDSAAKFGDDWHLALNESQKQPGKHVGGSETATVDVVPRALLEEALEAMEDAAGRFVASPTAGK